MFGPLLEDRWWELDYRRRICWRSLFRIHPSGNLQFGELLDIPFCQGNAYPFALAEVLVMLANSWSPPPLRLLALEATEPAEEAIKRSITRYKLNNKSGKLPYVLP